MGGFVSEDLAILSLESFAALGTGAAVSAAILVIGHWMPLPFTADGLPKTVFDLIFRYVYGNVAIWIGSAIWIWAIGLWPVAAGLMCINIAGGVAVALAYAWDDIIVKIRQANIARIVSDEE